tara:strand:- start:33 stop:383 length:351 start_codon:yes stop_codon:yes gene_type:complete
MHKGDKLTDYEWIVEPIDKHEDIIDVIHCETFKSTLYYLESIKSYGEDCIRVDVAIRQRVYRYEDLDEQYYNYLEKINGLWTMPEYFLDWGTPTDIKVPKRFFKELELINRSKLND